MTRALSRSELRRFLREHRIGTQAEFKRVRKRLRRVRDPLAERLPPLGARDFARLGCDWYALLGKPPAGRGSARVPGASPSRAATRGWLAEQGVPIAAEARARNPRFKLYERYALAKRSAKKGRFRNQSDYRARRAAHDPRLPVDPEARWPGEFAKDGWPGYLGTGAANHELRGLVSQCDAFHALGLSHAEWKTILHARRIAPAARRRRRNADMLYFRVADLVALAMSLGMPKKRATSLRARLHEVAYGLTAQTS